MSKFIYDGLRIMSRRDKGTKWDGKSRVSNDLYRKNWNEIFKKGIVGKDVTLKETKKLLEEIADRNGF